MVLLSLGLSARVRRSLTLPDDLARGLWVVGLFYLAVGVGALITFALPWALLRRKVFNQTLEPNSDIDAFSSFEAIRTWLANDQPVTRLKDDVFSRGEIARRIARRLSQTNLPAQALVGRLGSGKSTIRALVADALAQSDLARRVRLVPVELWPYETSRAAVEAVLHALVAAIGTEVNVIGLQGLPKSYQEMMSAAGGWGAAIARAQGVPSAPVDVLRAVDAIALAIGLRYVVWIEDLERFAGGVQPDEEKLNAVRALLYGMEQLQGLTVIVATTTLKLRFDIEKIARFVEDIPRLPEREVARVLRQFRVGCLGQTDLVDPCSAAIRRDLDRLGDEEYFDGYRVFAPGPHSIVDALPTLCATPRSLKQALRACLDVWEDLPGEIDFDDTLVLSILREGYPDVFALVQENLHFLRSSQSRDDEAQKKSEERWSAALAGLNLDEQTKKSVQVAIAFVFGPNNVRRKPQGVRQQGHVDYWQRFMARPVLANDERDQPLLREMLSGDNDRLVALLRDEKRSPGFEDFYRILPPERLLQLLAPLGVKAAASDPAAWTNEKPPGLVPLWRIWNRLAERGKAPPEVVLDQLMRTYDISVPANLALAAQVEHYFVAAERGVSDLLRDNDGASRAAARNYVRSALVRTYEAAPELLARNLRGAHDPTLLWLTWGIDRVRAKTLKGLPFDEWPEFAVVIVQAARIEPRSVLPQIACLVTRRASEFHGKSVYRFDNELCTRLFGDSDSVLALFDSENPADWPEDRPGYGVLVALGKASPPSGGRYEAEYDDID